MNCWMAILMDGGQVGPKWIDWCMRTWAGIWQPEGRHTE